MLKSDENKILCPIWLSKKEDSLEFMNVKTSFINILKKLSLKKMCVNSIPLIENNLQFLLNDVKILFRFIEKFLL